ncbi:MAG: hypothetical protein PVG78_14290 [Desulfobacterales bacterium]|jgi:hypothetical protein
MSDRRQKRRYVIKDDLIVFDLQTRCELGYVKNICRGGLAFEYFDVGKMMLALGEFGLLDWQEQFAVSKVPYRIVGDRRLDPDDHCPVPLRLCNVKFRCLSQRAIRELNNFLQRLSMAAHFEIIFGGNKMNRRSTH